ncbi:MAG: glycerophosphodiester phosphodiesterase family protein, partial [Myxococcales bacterium]|nr:glycerophosphodiester phosphodiesterase family protein [Myxococcales bacterium]
MKALSLLLLAGLFAGCGDDSPSGGAAAGGSGTGGAEGAGGADQLGAEDFLDPARYDCGASGPFDPPERPYPFGCIHDPDCTSRFVVAHRMGSRFAPENSLAALRASILLGVDIVETDVRMTKDGHAVLLHDGEIDRTLAGTGAVNDLTLAELQALEMLPNGDPTSGDFSCERIPTVEEALALGAGKIVIEFETKEVAAAIVAAEHMQAEGLYESAYIQCTPDECDQVRAVVPDVPIMVRVTQMDQLPIAAAYDPPPILVEVSPETDFLEAEVLDGIRSTGTKTFTDVFTSADLAWLFDSDVSLFPYFY